MFSMCFAGKKALAGAAASASAAPSQSGREGEDAALAYLTGQGLALVARNFQTKTGEIDLIMKEGETLVFVEVRRRSHKGFGGAAASVTPAKQKRLVKTAQFFLQQYHGLPACRFDVVAIDGARLSWLKNVIDEG